MGTSTIETEYDAEPLINHLASRREFFANQAEVMEELKQGHKKNFYKSHHRIEDLLTVLKGKIDFKGTTAPALRNGVGQLKKKY
jgi:hypothetical protein